MKMLSRRGRNGLVAVAVAAALVAVPAMSANAAVVPTVGSDKPLYLQDTDTGIQIPAGTSLNWNANIVASPEANDEDYNAAFPAPAGTTKAVTFLAPRGQEKNYTSWNAFASLGNPSQLLMASITPSGNTSAGQGSPSGAGAVAIAGGDYSLGVAFLVDETKTVLEADFTFITVVANANPNNATWTFDTPTQAVFPDFANYSATAGASAVIRNGNLEIDATAANANKTVDVFVEGTAAKVATVTLSAQGKAVNTLPAGVSTGKRLVLAEGQTAVAWVAASDYVAPAPVEPTGTPNATISTPAEGDGSVTIDAGVANAGKTLRAVGWSNPTELGNVLLDSNGMGTVSIVGLSTGATHTIALLDTDNAVVAWGTVAIPAPTYTLQSEVDLSAEVLNSGKFALEGAAAPVNLGSIKRGGTTAAVPLGAFTVTDDRDDLKGWTLKADVADFVNGGNTIAKSALGVTPKIVGGETDGISTGATQVAGSGVYSATLADAAVGSTTIETGAQLDADLTFKAPKTAKKGTYTSTITLTLVSK
ncbi:hypothetical protein SAMN05428970_2639 [Agromyces sp. CF514]|uniref:hypothetical protein n=1 Tax=Agromyces sp. CF514 TaxID=1881031 RepID=UPI0008E27891|nr:hypothetical protein [Agromyces sp. CF514]SFR82620.1 hypothetical protein SAMN05428970_2639 [Agromyces sp. CF514]